MVEGQAPVGDRDPWLTWEYLAWRPAVVDRAVTWRELKRLWKCWRNLDRQVTAKSPKTSLASILSARENAYGRLMQAAYSEFGWMQRPGSVRVADWLDRQRLPTFGLGWRAELWYRALAWEYEQWARRINQKGEFRYRRAVSALRRKLTHRVGGPPDPLPDKWWLSYETSMWVETEIIDRWLLLHGRYHRWEQLRKVVRYVTPQFVDPET